MTIWHINLSNSYLPGASCSSFLNASATVMAGLGGVDFGFVLRERALYRKKMHLFVKVILSRFFPYFLRTLTCIQHRQSLCLY